MNYKKMSREDLIREIETLQKELGQRAGKGEIARIVHELQVHQVELEMQNRELIEARAEIESARDRYADLYDYAPSAYFTLDDRGMILELNLAAAAMLGREKASVVGVSLAYFLFRADMSAFYRHLGESVQKGRSASDLRIQRGTEPVYAHAESRLYKHPVTGQATIRTALIDISMRKKTEELTLGLARSHAARRETEKARKTIERSEAIYRAIGESVPYGIWIAGPDGGMQYLSKSFLDLTGNSMEECMGKGWLSCLVSEDLERITAEWMRCITGGLFCDMEYRLRGTDGRTYEILCRGIPIRNERGEVERWAGVNMDITMMKKAEQELMEEKERLFVTLTSIGECVITLDREDRVLYLNREAERLTGWKQEEAAGRKAGEVLAITDQRDRSMKDPLELFAGQENGASLYGNLELVNRFGVGRLIAGTLASLKNAKGEVMGNVIVFRDITGAKRMEDELLKVRKLESLGALASGIAHEFTTLLTSIKGNIELAMEEPPKESIRRLEEAGAVIEIAKSLANQLITFSHGLRPVKEVAYIEDVVKPVFVNVCNADGIECRYSIDPGTWLVEIDSDQIMEALRNILTNAREASARGGMIELRSTNIEVSEGQMPPLSAGAYVWITIKDTGKGIPEGDLPRVFDPFFTSKPGKSGLGLTISYSIIRNHGGYIMVDSRPGEGTAVHVFLPALKASRKAEAA